MEEFVRPPSDLSRCPCINHPCRSSKSKVFSKAYRQMGGETTVAIGNISGSKRGSLFLRRPFRLRRAHLAHVYCRTDRSPAGKIVVKGREVSGPPPNLVLVFQEFNKSLFAWRSVLGNVLFSIGSSRKKAHDPTEKLKHSLNLSA